MNWLTGNKVERTLRNNRTDTLIEPVHAATDAQIGGELWHPDCIGLMGVLEPRAYNKYLLHVSLSRPRFDTPYLHQGVNFFMGAT